MSGPALPPGIPAQRRKRPCAEVHTAIMSDQDAVDTRAVRSHLPRPVVGVVIARGC